MKEDIRTGVVYLATHPSLEGFYIGATYTPLSKYNTSSPVILSLVKLTGIRPNFHVIETYEVDFSQKDDTNRQIIFQREMEIYDEMVANGKISPHQNRPTGVCYRVTRRFCEGQEKPNSEEVKRKKRQSMKGKNSNDEFSLRMQLVPNKGFAKPANIYNYDTDELLHENVILTSWCKERGLNKSCFSQTARGEKRHYRRMYARYIEDLASKV